jgi:hypothetical protein
MELDNRLLILFSLCEVEDNFVGLASQHRFTQPGKKITLYVVNISDCIMSNGRLILNIKLDGIWKEAVLA